MWNELFITYNGPSLFCELLSNYTRAQERQLIRILKIKEHTCSLIKLGEVPFLINSTFEKTSSIIDIAKFICTLTGTFDILFGRSETVINGHIAFINDFNAASNKLDFLENQLYFNSFCNGYHITISDIYAFAMVIVSIQHCNESEKLKYFNVFRWALHIQGLKGIEEQISRLKMTIYQPSDKLFIEINSKIQIPVSNEKEKEKANEKIDINVEKEPAKESKKNEKKKPEEKSKIEAKGGDGKDNKETKEPKEGKEQKEQKQQQKGGKRK